MNSFCSRISINNVTTAQLSCNKTYSMKFGSVWFAVKPSWRRPSIDFELAWMQTTLFHSVCRFACPLDRMQPRVGEESSACRVRRIKFTHPLVCSSTCTLIIEWNWKRRSFTDCQNKSHAAHSPRAAQLGGGQSKCLNANRDEKLFKSTRNLTDPLPPRRVGAFEANVQQCTSASHEHWAYTLHTM